MKFVDRFYDFIAMYKSFSVLYRFQTHVVSILTSAGLVIITAILSIIGLTPVLISIITASIIIGINIVFPFFYYFTEYSQPIQVSHPTTQREKGPPSDTPDKKTTIRSVYTIIEFFVKFDDNTTKWVIRIETPNDVISKISKTYWSEDWSLTREDPENLEIECLTGHNYLHFSFGIKAKCTKPYVKKTGWIKIYCAKDNEPERIVRNTRFWYLY